MSADTPTPDAATPQEGAAGRDTAGFNDADWVRESVIEQARTHRTTCTSGAWCAVWQATGGLGDDEGEVHVFKIDRVVKDGE